MGLVLKTISGENMGYKKAIALASLALPIVLLTGCSAGGSAAAKDICGAPGPLTDIEGDPNTESGASVWMSYYNKATELRDSSSATEEEVAVANAMVTWFNAAVKMDEADLGWGEYGTEFSDAGMNLISACEPFLGN